MQFGECSLSLRSLGLGSRWSRDARDAVWPRSPAPGEAGLALLGALRLGGGGGSGTSATRTGSGLEQRRKHERRWSP